MGTEGPGSVTDGGTVPQQVPIFPSPRAPQPDEISLPTPEVRTDLEELQAQTEEVTDKQSLQVATQALNKLLAGLEGRLEFEVFDGTGILTVRVMNRTTGEIIRQMPPEQFLILRGKLRNYLGIVLNEEA